MAAKRNKTDPRNRATPVDQLRGSAKAARIRRVTQAEAGPQSYSGPSVGQTKRTAGRPQRALPPRGGTSAGSVKATAQRVTSAVRQRAQLDTLRTKALADTLIRNSQREARKIPADPSPKVRYVGPEGSNPKGKALPQGADRKVLPPGERGGAVVRAGSSAVTRPSSRNQAALPPGQRGGAATTSRGGALANREAPRPRPGGRVVVDESPRLPQGKPGGDLARRPRRMGSEQPQNSTTVRTAGGSGSAGSLPSSTQPSARRTAAQAKLDQAAKGTSGGTRVGQPAGEANRMYGANRVNAAVERALRQRGSGGLGSSLRGAGAEGLVSGLALAALSPLAQKAGTALGKGLRPVGRWLDDRMPGINSKDEQRRRALPQMTAAERKKAVPLPQAQPKSAPSRPSQAEQAPTRPSSAPSRYSAPTTPSRPSRPAAAAPRPQAQPSSVDTNPYGKAQGDPRRFNTQADLGIPAMTDVPDYSQAKTSGRFVQEFPEPEAPKRKRRRAVGRDEMIQDNLRR